MLYRAKAPNQHTWNGLGGKIEPGENPYDSVIREVMEEADINIRELHSLRYTGIVTWTSVQEESNVNKGMYAYVCELKEKPDWNEKQTPEGLIQWKTLEWACDKKNKELVSNLPHFLSHMLKNNSAVEYRCIYEGKKLQEVLILPIETT